MTYLIRGADGDPYTPPHDERPSGSISLEDWFRSGRLIDFSYQEKSESMTFFNNLKKKVELFDRVLKLASHDRAYLDVEDFRHEPYVIENFFPITDDGAGARQTIFIFKMDNNGTTIRVVDQDSRLPVLFGEN